ncbi:MAG: hypothetical protein KDA55_10560, partial [Planctomycetales bacterium]|nr:hypothetical protein [Planctomycetales bacterium]
SIDTKLDIFSNLDLSKSAEYWVELVSGARGSTLWHYSINPKCLESINKSNSPLGFRWYLLSELRSKSSSSGGDPYIRDPSAIEFAWGYVHLPDGPHVEHHGVENGASPGGVVRLIAGDSVIALNLQDGDVIGDEAMTHRPGGPAIYADCDGDGEVEVVYLETVGAGLYATAGAKLVVWSLAQNKELWTHSLDTYWPHSATPAPDRLKWPLVVDLDQDGVSEVVAPLESPKMIGKQSSPYASVAVFEGASGAKRWQRLIPTVDMQVNHLTTGPDIDGDGVNEVYVATLWGSRMDLYVDCLSGADGHTLWRTSRRIWPLPRMSCEAYIAEIGWWNSGGDGWPQCYVSVRSGDTIGIQPTIYFFSAGTGELRDFALLATSATTFDINGDGADELFTYYSPPIVWDFRNRNSVIIGHWTCNLGLAAKRFVEHARATLHVSSDLDDDGVGDLISISHDGKSVRAISAAQGHYVWTHRAGSNTRYASDRVYPEFTSEPRSGRLGDESTEADLNGDGVSDVMLCRDVSRREPSPLVAISGADGRTLWSAEFPYHDRLSAGAVRFVDLDADGHSEVVAVVRTSEQSTEIVAYSGRRMRRLWRHELPRSFGRASIDVLPTTKDDRPRLLVTLYWNRDAMWSVVSADGQVQNVSPQARRVGGWTVAEMGTGSPSRLIACGPGAGGDGKSLWVRDLELQGASQNEVTFDGAPEGNKPVMLRTPHGMLITVEEWYSSRKLKLFDANLTPMRCVSDWSEWLDLQKSTMRVGACDVDGDGYDELLCATNSFVWTMRVETGVDGVVRLSPPLWSARNNDLSAELFRFEAARGIVIVRRGRMLQALAVSTGKPQWYCQIPFADVLGMHPYQLIYGRNALMELPHLLFSDRDRAYCIQAVPSVAQSRSGELQVGNTNVARLIPDLHRGPPRLAPESYDPRLRTGLPWVPHPDYQDWNREYQFHLQSVGLSVCLVVLPLGFAIWIGSRRQWGLRTMLAAPFVIGVFISALLVQSDQIV